MFVKLYITFKVKLSFLAALYYNPKNPRSITATRETSSSLVSRPPDFWIWVLGSVLDSGKCSGFWEVFWDPGKCFGFWQVFWILGSVFGSWEVFMDSGKRFGFWEVFWILGSVYGFWEVFWIMESVLSLWATVYISSCAPIKSKLQHPRPGKPKAFELLKIGSFQYSSPHGPK